jgi:hypothetical protein
VAPEPAEADAAAVAGDGIQDKELEPAGATEEEHAAVAAAKEDPTGGVGEREARGGTRSGASPMGTKRPPRWAVRKRPSTSGVRWNARERWWKPGSRSRRRQRV